MGIRFGLFDFDTESRELRREGSPVRLQAQPAQVLHILLSNAGALVTREELRLAIWGTETFVDFDRGLNFCVSQIRSALGDSADSPRFIRTIPKKGYQFIAPVDSDLPQSPSPKTVSRRWPLSIAIAGFPLGALAVMGWNAWRERQDQPQTRVGVTRFDNETGNPAFDVVAEALTDSVTVELAAGAENRFQVIGNAVQLRVPRAQRDLLAIGTSLKVSFVILGQLQQSATSPLVLAHLIAVPEQNHVLVVRHPLNLSDAAHDEVEIAREIATAFARPIREGIRKKAAPAASHPDPPS